MGKFEVGHKYPCKDYKRLHRIYHHMKRRCTNEDCPRYKDYGGRGITVCDEWLEDYDNFIEWALNNGYEDNLTIDRIDNDGNYEPSNCRWITREAQSRNKRTNVMVAYKGETKCLKEWCDILDLPYDATNNRIVALGWDVEKAFTEPLFDNEKSLARAAKMHGISPHAVQDRVHKLGWDLETALNTPVGSVDKSTKEYKEAHFGYATCAVCGKRFLKQNSRMKYCDRECTKASQRVWYKRKLQTA